MVIASKGQKPLPAAQRDRQCPTSVSVSRVTPTPRPSFRGHECQSAEGRSRAQELLAEFPEGVHFEFIEDASLKTPLAFGHVEIASVNPVGLRAWYGKMFLGTKGRRRKGRDSGIPRRRDRALKRLTAAGKPPPKAALSITSGSESNTDWKPSARSLEAAGTPVRL